MSEPTSFAGDLEPAAPPPPAAPAPDPRRRRLGGGCALVVAALLGSLLTRCLSSDPPAPAPVVQVVRPTPDVITAVQALVRLETTSFHVERVVDLRDQQRVLFGATVADDAILLVAAGDVVAGVDLAGLRPEDVVIDEARRRVRVTLPAPEVFSARLDNDRTFVYERSTDLLARRSETLETRARQEAERTLRQAALEGGLLERAGNQARTAITALLHSLGYEDVEVRLRTDER